ncbi:hypothetical protein [Modicisalibacter ilicicola]|uniref:hypothetical protein n=1 Tax=Modicisalibacter ilicicola TaxID=480814 RepID=UPI001115018D|nr:hypothetical protein [Halomonas ilicicola]
MAGLVMACSLTAVADAVPADYPGDRLLHEATTGPSLVAPTPPGLFAQARVIEAAEMAELRGGFTAGGIDMSFGATLRTMIDDIRLETVMNITRTGQNIVSQTLENTSHLRDMADRPRVDLVGPGTGRPVTETTPERVDLAGLENLSGVAVQDAKGFSAALHRLTQESILSTVVSNASGRDIRQQLDIRLDIHNLEALRAAQTRSRIINSLNR